MSEFNKFLPWVETDKPFKTPLHTKVHPQFKAYIQRDISEMLEHIGNGLNDATSAHLLSTLGWLMGVLCVLIDEKDPKYLEACDSTHTLVDQIAAVDPLD